MLWNKNMLWNNCTIVILAVLASNHAFGWGDTGHRVVGEIAESRLTTRAKANIRQILNQESLAEASTWGDDVRSDDRFKKFETWHYVEIPDGSNYANSTKNPEGDLIMAIQTMQDIINKKSQILKPKEALRFLVHFLGDLHQPLHVGNGLDKGGNVCTVKYAGRNANLHVLWDSLLIQSRELSFTEWARFLMRSDLVTEAKIKNWETGNVESWASESMSLRDSLYPPANDTKSNKVADRNYCKKNEEESVPTPLIPVLGYDYEYKFKKRLDEQLVKGGVRLAAILNQLFR